MIENNLDDKRDIFNTVTIPLNEICVCIFVHNITYESPFNQVISWIHLQLEETNNLDSDLISEIQILQIIIPSGFFVLSPCRYDNYYRQKLCSNAFYLPYLISIIWNSTSWSMNSTLNKYLGMIERYFSLDGYFVFECLLIT